MRKMSPWNTTKLYQKQAITENFLLLLILLNNTKVPRVADGFFQVCFSRQ